MVKPQIEARRFLFDHSFDAPKKPTKKLKPDEAPPPEPTFSRQQLEDARREGYEQGRLAGAAEAAAATDAEVARLIDEIAGRLPAVEAALVEANDRLMRDGAAVVAAVMRKILPSLVDRNGLEEIDTLLRQCLSNLIDQPKIIVRVGTRHAEAISARLAEAAAAGRFAGRFMMEADQAMGPSDCRVSWQGGGLERKADEIWQQVERAVERYLAAEPAAKDLPAVARDGTEER